MLELGQQNGAVFLAFAFITLLSIYFHKIFAFVFSGFNFRCNTTFDVFLRSSRRPISAASTAWPEL
jgi:hypothetical protein